VRADDCTYIGCQALNVEFEAGNLTRKEATIIIQSVQALDAIKHSTSGILTTWTGFGKTV
jgi:hypothetical protein